MRTPIIIAALAVLLAGTAFAQPTWESTGTVEVTVDGEERSLSTFVAHVDEDLADDVEDEEASDFASRVAGTDQHTATWMATEPVTVGDSVVAPAALHVRIDARPGAGPDEDEGSLIAEFPLDPATLTPLDAFETALRWFPESYGGEGYATTEATVRIDSAEVVNDTTISLRGSIQGTLAYEGESSEASEAVDVRATFEIDRVVGSTLLQELVGAE